MDLCTVISENFIHQAINLIQSYKVNSFDKRVFLYYFNTKKEKLDIFKELFKDQVELIEVEKTCDHALSPRVFFYKVYAIKNCLTKHSKSMIYSDSANCFVRSTEGIEKYLIDESLFLSYPYEALVNKYWTTKKCLEEMNSPMAEIMPQYWAGFQVYNRTPENLNFVKDMYDSMLNPDIALPDTTHKNPDGPSSPCIEHRQDQSVFSIMIHKHNRHQPFDFEKNNKFGDWQTMVNFDKDYRPAFDKMVLSPRESKFGNFRYLNV